MSYSNPKIIIPNSIITGGISKSSPFTNPFLAKVPPPIPEQAQEMNESAESFQAITDKLTESAEQSLPQFTEVNKINEADHESREVIKSTLQKP